VSVSACPPPVVVTGLGICCALGDDPSAVERGVVAGLSGVRSHPKLGDLPGGDGHDHAGWVTGPKTLRAALKRRKDRKLLARPAQLALVAADSAVAGWPGDREELGIFLGVGREPADDGQSEPALCASARDGQLDEALLAGPGRDLYPPLLPLRTLPNMALAHISINLDIRGENGAWAGGAAAGLRAAVAGIAAVAAGRCPAALIGGADSLIHTGLARDRLRLGLNTPPGEAGVVLLIEPLPVAWERGGRIWAQVAGVPDAEPDEDTALHAALGDCGAADGVLALALAVVHAHRRGIGRLVARADPGQPAIGIRVRPPGPC